MMVELNEQCLTCEALNIGWWLTFVLHHVPWKSGLPRHDKEYFGPNSFLMVLKRFEIQSELLKLLIVQSLFYTISTIYSN